MIEAGLVAGDAGVDAVAATGTCFLRPSRVGQQRPRHRDHIRGTVGKDALGHLGHVDAVGGDQRDRHFTLELLGHPGKARARHTGDDGRHARFMPADASVDDAGAGRFDRLGQRHDLAPVLAALDQIEHRQPVDDDEVAPDRGARAADDFDREAHASRSVAAPGVAAVVGARGNELVDQIAFRTHHLDAVVAGVLRELRALHEVFNGAFHAS